MLFQTKGGEAYTDRVKAFATSHALTLNGETQEINTKDHSQNNTIVLGKYNWEVSTEGLFTQDDFDSLFDAMVTGEPFKVIFGIKAEDDTFGQNIVDGDYQTYTNDNCNYYSGNVIISSLVANANNGENATCSITFTGVGKLIATFNWEDITTKLLANSTLRANDGIITDWAFCDSNATPLADNCYQTKTNYVLWRSNSSDKTVFQEITVPYTGIYRLSIDHYTTYESGPTVVRQYGKCKMLCYSETGSLLVEMDLASNAEESSIMRGKSATALTANDVQVEVDGKAYYVPNFQNETSVQAYLDTGKYKLQKQFRLTKGQKIRIVLGQNFGGSKTNAVYGFPKLEYKYE